MILPLHVLDTALKQAFRKAQTDAEYAASRDAAQRQQTAGRGGFPARAAPKSWTEEVRTVDMPIEFSFNSFGLESIVLKTLES
jgi:hypothetical protein